MRAESLLDGSVAAGVSVPGSGMVDAEDSSTSISFGSVAGSGCAGVAERPSVGTPTDDLPNQPSQPDEVTGRCDVSGAGGCGLGVSPMVLPASLPVSTGLPGPLLSPVLAISAGPSVGPPSGAVATTAPLRPVSAL